MGFRGLADGVGKIQKPCKTFICSCDTGFESFVQNKMPVAATTGISFVSPSPKPLVPMSGLGQKSSSYARRIDRPTGYLASFIDVFGLFESRSIARGFE